MARTLNHEVSILKFAPNGADNDMKDVFARDMICEDVETGNTASKPYAAGAFLIWKDRKVYQAKQAIASGATLSNAANGNLEAVGPLCNLKQALSNEVVTRSTLGAHNLGFGTPYFRNSGYESSSITYTYDSDGVITANGTKGTSASYFEINTSVADYPLSNTELEVGKSYILSGGVSNNKYLAIQFFDSSKTSINAFTSKGSDTSFTVPSGSVYVKMYITITDTAQLTNVKFYPMIRLATDSDTTYQPYAKTNQELTKDDSGLTENAFANGAVNLLPNTKTSITESGITYTVNDDDSVLVNAGTARSGGSTFAIESSSDNWKLPAGRYKLSGAPTSIDGTFLQFNIRAILSSGTVNFSENGDRGNGLEFTITDAMVNDASYKLVVFINLAGSKTLSSNMLIKPMITVADMPNSDYYHYVPYAMTNKELTDVAQQVVENYISTNKGTSIKSLAVTGDGVKTYRELLGELLASILSTAQGLPDNMFLKLNNLLMYVPNISDTVYVGNQNECARPALYNQTTAIGARYFRDVVFNANLTALVSATLHSTASSIFAGYYDFTTNTRTNLTDEVVPSDKKITIYYDVYKKIV